MENKLGTILETFTNEEDGIEFRVVVHVKGFAVVCVDLDANEVLPFGSIYKDIEKAKLIAKSNSVGGYAGSVML